MLRFRGDFSTDATYIVDNIVVVSDAAKVAIADNGPGSYDSADWRASSFSEIQLLLPSPNATPYLEDGIYYRYQKVTRGGQTFTCYIDGTQGVNPSSDDTTTWIEDTVSAVIPEDVIREDGDTGKLPLADVPDEVVQTSDDTGITYVKDNDGRVIIRSAPPDDPVPGLTIYDPAQYDSEDETVGILAQFVPPVGISAAFNALSGRTKSVGGFSQGENDNEVVDVFTVLAGKMSYYTATQGVGAPVGDPLNEGVYRDTGGSKYRADLTTDPENPVWVEDVTADTIFLGKDGAGNDITSNRYVVQLVDDVKIAIDETPPNANDLRNIRSLAIVASGDDRIATLDNGGAIDWDIAGAVSVAEDAWAVYQFAVTNDAIAHTVKLAGEIPSGDADVLVDGGVLKQRDGTTIDTDQVPEGGNLYAQDEDAVIAAGVLKQRDATAITTDALTEGATNKYFHDAAVVALATNTPAVAQVSQVICVADVSSNLQNKYFRVYDGDNAGYYVWMNVGGLGVDPAPGGGLTGVEVTISADDADTVVATNTRTALLAVSPSKWTVTRSTATLTITNLVAGASDDAVDIDSGFTCSTTLQGADEVVPALSAAINTLIAEYLAANGASGTVDATHAGTVVDGLTTAIAP